MPPTTPQPAAGDGGTLGVVLAIAVMTVLAIGVAMWIRAMLGRGRVARPTGVNRLRPAAVH
jgi:hypothetical protein